MIDPAISLAFSIHAAPGRYAILLGSGVSSAAGIPTGWAITLDLVRKLAVAQGEECDDDPETWYREKHGQSPSYSRILDELAKTPYDRREVLSSYIEAEPDNPDTDSRQPTAAHQAIADLVRHGHVSVILTTNFDRLLEQALSAVNVEAVVLSTPEQMDSAPPISHTKCTVVKVHGDYLDPAIRNTEDELESYPEALNNLLDRVIDEYGLIVCGWSGDWDPALRAAFDRGKTRRFATYWATIGQPSDAARSLTTHREAQLVDIEDADSFFALLSDRIGALRDNARPHPESIDAAVALMKRYLAEPRYRIQLRDLIDREVDVVVQRTSPEHFPMNIGQVTADSITNRLKAYEAATESLIPLAMVGAVWAEPEHLDMWQGALNRLSTRDEGNGFTLLLNLQRYPATLLLYALGIGAVHARRLHFLGQLFSTPIIGRHHRPDNSRAATALAADLANPGGDVRSFILGLEQRKVALSDWLHVRMMSHSQFVTRDPEHFTKQFDRFEFLLALNFASRPPEYLQEFAPMGAFGYRGENRDAMVSEINKSIDADGNDSPYITSGVVGATVEEYKNALAIVEANRKTRFQW